MKKTLTHDTIKVEPASANSASRINNFTNAKIEKRLLHSISKSTIHNAIPSPNSMLHIKQLALPNIYLQS